MQQILGFAPDLSVDTPGLVVDCSEWVPFEAGYKGAPTAVSMGVAALAAECRGAAVLTKLDGTRRLFAGTQTKLYELNGTTWTDRSAGGGSYTGSVESRWSFCQFGDTSIASNLVDSMQASTVGAFAAIAGAPKAKIVVSLSNNFVMAFNTNEGTYGVAPDRWWCCAQSDVTNWTPSVATGATTGRLVAVEGAIQAAAALGDYVVAYKSRGLFLGQFVGSANGTWQFNAVRGANNCGAVGPEAVCDIGGRLFSVGEDDFWIFDGGSVPERVGQEVRDWFKRNSSATFRYRTRCTYDRTRQLVWIAFASPSSTGQCDRNLVFHIGTRKCGRSDFVSEAPIIYQAPGVVIDGLDTYAATIDALPPVPFDSQYWLQTGREFAYFNSSHAVMARIGPCATSSFTTGDTGDDDVISVLDRARIRFQRAPTSAQATALSKILGSTDDVTGPTETMFQGRFDLRQSGNWHSVRFDMVGDHQENAFDLRTFADAEQ